MARQEELRIAKDSFFQTIDVEQIPDGNGEVEQLFGDAAAQVDLADGANGSPTQAFGPTPTDPSEVPHGQHRVDAVPLSQERQQFNSPGPVAPMKTTRKTAISKSSVFVGHDENMSAPAGKTPSASAGLSGSSGETKRTKGARIATVSFLSQQMLETSFARAEGASPIPEERSAL